MTRHRYLAIRWRPVGGYPPSQAQDGTAHVDGQIVRLKIRSRQTRNLICLVNDSVVTGGRSMSDCKRAVDRMASLDTLI